MNFEKIKEILGEDGYRDLVYGCLQTLGYISPKTETGYNNIEYLTGAIRRTMNTDVSNIDGQICILEKRIAEYDDESYARSQFESFIKQKRISLTGWRDDVQQRLDIINKSIKRFENWDCPEKELKQVAVEELKESLPDVQKKCDEIKDFDSRFSNPEKKEKEFIQYKRNLIDGFKTKLDTYRKEKERLVLKGETEIEFIEKFGELLKTL